MTIVYIVTDKKYAMNVKLEQSLEIIVLNLVKIVLNQELVIIQEYVMKQKQIVKMPSIQEKIVQFYVLTNTIIVKNAIEIINASNV